MKKILYILGILSTPLLFIQCSGDKTKTAEFKGAPIPVKVSSAHTSAEDGETLVSGKIISKNAVNISTRIMGYISSLPAEIGQEVKAGQALVTINSTEIDAKSGQIDAQINQAQANYDIAKKDYDRFKNLFDSESASQKELDDMTARYKMAKANLEAAHEAKKEVNANKNYIHMTAPISGLITEKHVDIGDLAHPGSPLLRIESTRELQVQALLSEKSINLVKTGMKVKILLPLSDEKIEGTVNEVSRSAAQTGGQYRVKIDLPEAGELLPGMFVRVLFPFGTLAESRTAILISSSALVRKGQLQGVYVVSQQNTAILRWLQIGRQFGEEVEVLSGLSQDERYIIQAEEPLHNGARIVIH